MYLMHHNEPLQAIVRALVLENLRIIVVRSLSFRAWIRRNGLLRLGLGPFLGAIADVSACATGALGPVADQAAFLCPGYFSCLRL